MIKHLWIVQDENALEGVMVITYEKEVDELVDICERNGYDNIIKIEYFGEAVS